jgi:hypothetical protein
MSNSIIDQLRIEVEDKQGWRRDALRLADRTQELERLIGQPPEGSHPDEWLPRAETWHQERANWADEVERLRAHIQRLERKK